MDKCIHNKDELKCQFDRKEHKEQIKIEKEVKKEELPIDPKFVFDKTVKNKPKQRYRKPKSMESNSPKNPFKMNISSKY